MRILKITLIVSLLLNTISSFGQNTNCNEMGIKYTYDAAGNRTSREYYVINYLVCPPDNPTSIMANRTYEDDANLVNTNNIQHIDAIYPNPTSGIFNVTFANPLKNANITVTDINGKIVKQFVGNGFKLTIDIASLTTGTYFFNVIENKRTISKKIVKQ